MFFKPILEFLEERDLLSANLEIGHQESYTFFDGDGDEITIRITGSTGQLTLLENTLDAIGNEDGTLEDGEDLGQMLISRASIDFAIFVEAVDSGDGIVRLGEVDASDSVVRGLYTNGLVGKVLFELDSFTARDFSTGGAIHVDVLNDKVALFNFSSATIVEIRQEMLGGIIVRDQFRGRLVVGGDWNGDSIIGEDFTGLIEVGGDVAADVKIIGNFSGRAEIGGSVWGQWLVVGSLSGQFQAGGDIANLRIVDDLSGKVVAGQSLWADIGDAVTSSGWLEGNEATAYVGRVFAGDFVAKQRGYVHVAEDVASTARIVSKGPLTVAYGSQIYSGAILASPQLYRPYLPALGKGQIIPSLPYVITTPGLYRLANTLLFNPASGNAIEVQASNVTIDLQGFTIHNTAGPTTQAVGIRGTNLTNVKVINGTVSGFFTGINLDGPGGHTYHVENVRAFENWYYGIYLEGTSSVARNNEVLYTGGLTVESRLIPISMYIVGAYVQVEDNIVYGLRRSSLNKEWVGIHIRNALGSSAARNIVAAESREDLTWGMWINGGIWGGYGHTYVFLMDNIFNNLYTAVTLVDHAGGVLSGNQILDTGYGISRGTDRGGNVALFRDSVIDLPPSPYLDPAQLRITYGFYLAGSYYYNLFGVYEKWFKDRFGHWYTLHPNGNLFLRTGTDLRTSELIGFVDSRYWNDPTELFEYPVTLNSAAQDKLSQLQEEYGFYYVGSYYRSATGFGEKWFKDRLDRWFALLPNGSLRLWNGKSLVTSEQIDIVNPLVFDEPTLLFKAPVTLSDEIQNTLTQLRTDYGFQFVDSYYQGVTGFGEKWFKDRTGVWFALLPDGKLIKWNEKDVPSSEVVAELQPRIFDKPELLFAASVEMPEDFLNELNQLQLDNGFYFVGSYLEGVTGHGEKWFKDRLGTWFGLLPDGTLIRWDENSVLTSEVIAQLSPLVFDDPTMLFTAPVHSGEELTEELHNLQHDFGFRFLGSYYESVTGYQEKWFKDRTDTWFALLPDGSLWKWDDNSLTTSTRIACLAPEVFHNPNLLFNAQKPLDEIQVEELSQLRNEYGFFFTGSYLQGVTGFGEKWFRDRNGNWFALLPNGELKDWNEESLETCNVIATLSPLVYDDPNLLLQAPPVLSEELKNTLAELQAVYDFSFSFSRPSNLGLNEKWFRDSLGWWYFLLSDGSLFQWDGISKNSSWRVVQLDPIVYQIPSLLG